MGISMIRTPSTCGWKVSWFTGEEKIIDSRYGKKKVVKISKHFFCRSKAEAEAKVKELKVQGIEPSLSECIW